jgi:hypothetical protein
MKCYINGCQLVVLLLLLVIVPLLCNSLLPVLCQRTRWMDGRLRVRACLPQLKAFIMTTAYNKLFLAMHRLCLCVRACCWCLLVPLGRSRLQLPV